MCVCVPHVLQSLLCLCVEYGNCQHTDCSGSTADSTLKLNYWIHSVHNMSDIIRLQMHSISTTWKKNYFMFWFTSQWSLSSGSHDTKDCTVKTSVFHKHFHLDYKNKLQGRNNDRNQATTVCRNLDTCTRVLALRGTTKWPERGFATVNEADKLQPWTLTAAGQYPVRFYIKRYNTASTSTESDQQSH